MLIDATTAAPHPDVVAELEIDATTAAPHPDVVAAEFDNGEAVLLHLVTGRYYILDQTGAYIWRLLGQGLNFGEIGRQFEVRFDETPVQAGESVIRVVGELAAEEFICIDDRSGAAD